MFEDAQLTFGVFCLFTYHSLLLFEALNLTVMVYHCYCTLVPSSDEMTTKVVITQTKHIKGLEREIRMFNYNQQHNV